MANESGITVEQVMERIRERVRARKQPRNGATAVFQTPVEASLQRVSPFSVYDLDELHHNIATNNELWNSVGTINPRHPGWRNLAIQVVKRGIARLLRWYTHPLHQFHSSVTRSLNETTRAVENLQKNLGVLREYVAESDQTTSARLETLQQHLDESSDTMQTRLGELEGLQKSNFEALQRELGGLDGTQKTTFAAVKDRLNRLEETLAADGHRTSARLDTLQQQLANLEASQKSLSASIDERISRMDEAEVAVSEKLSQQHVVMEQQLNHVQTELCAQIDNCRRDAFSLLDSYGGPRAREGLWFNEPVVVQYDDKGRPSWSGINERILEKGWVLRQLSGLSVGTKILDLGCAEGILSIELASSGFHVTGVDVRPYPLRHPNLMFVQADICKLQLEPESYDVIIALSTVEHIGLGLYGDPTRDSSDKAAMRRIYRLLKRGGQLLITVPFGVRAVLPLHRIYDRKLLRDLLRPFKIKKIDFGIKIDDKTWISPATEKQAAAQKHNATTELPSAVAMALCTKAKRR